MKILLIDDDSDDRFLFYEAVIEIAPDVDCITEQDGRKALADVYDGREGLPDVIFIDINMPVIDGWQCLNQLKNADRTKAIPVIMFSTSSAERDLDKVSQSKAEALVTKPHNFEELKRILLEIITAVREHRRLDFLQLQLFHRVSDLG